MMLKFMMEQTFRILDYTMNCISKLFNTGQVNADIQEEEDAEISDDMESSMNPSEMESLCISSEEGISDSFWANFDLK